MSRKKKNWSTTKKVVLSLVMVLVILIGTVLGFYKHIKNKIYVKKEPSISNNDSEFKEVEGITNVLLIGVDARDLDEPCRSDSMIIATLDNNNKKVKLTSLFRDTLVDIPGHGEAKLNAAYMLGGPELLMKTVKETYNVSIDKYIIINFWGFETIVDYIGGIEVDVKDYQLEELNKYGPESVDNFMSKAFGKKNEITTGDIDFQDFDDFILFILAEVRAELQISFYKMERVKEQEEIIKQGFRLPNFVFTRKELLHV